MPQAGGIATGDRIDLQALDRSAAVRAHRRRSRDASIPVKVTRKGRTFHTKLVASSPDYSPRATLTRYVGTPLCFFLSLALASALFLIRPRPITLAFYVYTMLMLVKVNQIPLDLAAWPISFASDLAIQVVYPAHAADDS